MKKSISTLLLIIFFLATAEASNYGQKEGGTAFLDIATGARAAGMGQAQSAVKAENSSAVETNPAALGELKHQSLTASSVALGFDRSLVSIGYSLPIAFKDFGSSDLAMRPKKKTPRFFKPPSRRQVTISVGYTRFGVENIQARSHYGAEQGTFEDSESALYGSLALNIWENFSIGTTFRSLKQNLELSSAKGKSFDAGIILGIPLKRKGRLNFSVVAKDFGGSLKWEASDPYLNNTYTYSEPLVKKIVFGSAYSSRKGFWLVTFDGVQVQGKLRPHAGIERKLGNSLALRMGSNANDPTMGIGFRKNKGRIDFSLDYAIEYSLDKLSNPQWITLGIGFLPSTNVQNKYDWKTVPSSPKKKNQLGTKPKRK